MFVVVVVVLVDIQKMCLFFSFSNKYYEDENYIFRTIYCLENFYIVRWEFTGWNLFYICFSIFFQSLTAILTARSFVVKEQGINVLS